MLGVKPEYGPHPCGFLEVDDELVGGGIHIITENWPASWPFAFAACGGDLVPGALADDFPFKLGKG